VGVGVAEKMADAPVFCAVTQVRHNSILTLRDYVPRIQEQFRRAGYADFRQGVQIAFTIPQPGAQDSAAVEPPAQKIEQYFFFDADGMSGFILLNNALAFLTTDYDTFPIFRTRLRAGLELVHEAVGGLSFIERIGIRYLNAVAPGEGESLRQYLEEELWGLPARLNQHIFEYSFTESKLLAEGIGEAVCRTVSQNRTLTFPPDLNLPGLKLKERFRQIVGEHATIDTDASTSQRMSFDVETVLAKLTTLHDLAETAFLASATDHARSVWKRKGTR
jgi:uncharacterized protein (TIGR04255 family)